MWHFHDLHSLNSLSTLHIHHSPVSVQSAHEMHIFGNREFIASSLATSGVLCLLVSSLPIPFRQQQQRIHITFYCDVDFLALPRGLLIHFFFASSIGAEKCVFRLSLVKLIEYTNTSMNINENIFHFRRLVNWKWNSVLSSRERQ